MQCRRNSLSSALINPKASQTQKTDTVVFSTPETGFYNSGKISHQHRILLDAPVCETGPGSETASFFVQQCLTCEKREQTNSRFLDCQVQMIIFFWIRFIEYLLHYFNALWQMIFKSH